MAIMCVVRDTQTMMEVVSTVEDYMCLASSG